MSFTKLLSCPMKLFRKEVITFIIIRRHDLDLEDDKLRYIGVKPSASISTLRHKVWHLLDLPDYCEEVIILKSNDNNEIPLTDLRKGNDPQHPFIMEVWTPSPGKPLGSTTTLHNMLLMCGRTEVTRYTATDTFEDKTMDVNTHFANDSTCNSTFSSLAKDSLVMNNLRPLETKPGSNLKADYKPSELACRVSSSSLLFKLQGRKSKDNFTNVLVKIQTDLVNLSNKLSSLENRLPGTVTKF